MLKLANPAISNVSMKFRYIKHYGARVGDDFVAKKISKLNVSNGYSMYIDYK